MTYPISDVTRRVVYSGSAGTGPYSFSFEILDEGDIAVYENATLLTITTDYTVTINADGTGSVALVSASTASDTVTILGSKGIERQTDFVTGGDLFANSLNDELDAQTIFAQQNAEGILRSLRAPVTDPTTVNMELPVAADRAGTVLGFNATTGDPEAGPTIADVGTLAAITADISTLADIEDGTDATDAIQTVAGISSNVTTVSGISSDVTTVSGISSAVSSVAADATDIGTVATNIASVNTVATNISDVITVANDLNEAISEIETAADDLNEAVSEIDTVAVNIANVNAVGTNISNVNTVAGISSDVTAVAGDATDIGTVSTNIANVNTVAGISGNVTTVAGIDTETTTVAGISANVTTVAGISGNVSTVAGVSANVTTVAGISGNVSTVAGISTDVTAVAADATDIGTVSTNIANVNAVGGSIANVNTVATNLTSVNNFGDRYRVSATEPTTSLDEGDLWFDTANDLMKVYSGSGWVNAGSSVNGTSARFKYTATSGQTTFTGADDNANTLLYDAGYIDVFLNGVHLDPSDYTATSGSSIVLASGAALNDELYVVAFGTFSVATHVLKSGDTMTGNLNFGDNVKANFGAGSDLQIYHDGSNSYVSEAGTGNLYLRAGNFFLQRSDGTQTCLAAITGAETLLYHAGNQKLSTTSTGIDVTGTVTADGLTVSGTSGEPLATFQDTDGTAVSVRLQDISDYADVLSNGGNFLVKTGSGTLSNSLRVNANNDISFYEDTGTTAKFFWDASAESLGIGTSSNQANHGLTVKAPASNYAQVALIGGDSSNYWSLQALNNSAATMFSYNGSEKMRIDSSGRVLINTTGQLVNEDKLSVTAGGNTVAFKSTGGDGTNSLLCWNSGTGTNRGLIAFGAGSSYSGVGSITTNGSSTSYNTSSDYRLKTDVQPMTGATERLKALKPVNFEWISSGERVDGFLAHEAQEVVPEAVTGTKDAMRTEEYEVTPAVLDDDGNVVTEAVMGEREVPDYQGIDQSKLVPLLVATVQEQQAVIESLTARIEALEA